MKMHETAKKRRDTYAIISNSPFVHTEFGFYVFEKWVKQGYMDKIRDPWNYDDYTRNLFMFDESGKFDLSGVAWCTAPFYPAFEEKLLEDRGEYELIQDTSGRGVLFFKGRRNGFMPEYVTHPVKDIQTWDSLCAWRLNPNSKERYEDLDKLIPLAVEAEKHGMMIVQRIVGCYMYLRSLIGPEELLYMFYDDPELIHTMLQKWFEVADRVCAYHQKFVTFDEVFFGEDICYNTSSLISPDMVREFLFPYYNKLLTNIKERQLDKTRKLNVQIDTDGNIECIIDLYKEIGANVFSPFEVASGSDVVVLGKKFPDIVIIGGIDKRILSGDIKKLEQYLDNLLPVMKKRGGFIPTCDHGVPDEVPFENYILYRRKCIEYGL